MEDPSRLFYCKNAGIRGKDRRKENGADACGLLFGSGVDVFQNRVRFLQAVSTFPSVKRRLEESVAFICEFEKEPVTEEKKAAILSAECADRLNEKNEKNCG